MAKITLGEQSRKRQQHSAAARILQSYLGKRWKLGREWGGRTFDLWNGQDYVAINISPLPPAQGLERMGKRTRILNFHELTVLEEPTQCAQVVEWVLEKG